MGFIVESRPLGSLKDFYRISKRNKFITLNDNLKNYQRQIECAHELGDYTLHRDFNTFMLSSLNLSNSRYEKQANRFAVYLILEYYEIKSLYGKTVNQLCCMTGLEPYHLESISQ